MKNVKRICIVNPITPSYYYTKKRLIMEEKVNKSKSKNSNEEDIKQASQLEKQGTSQIQADPLEISMTYNQFAFDDIFTQEKQNDNKDESNTSLNKDNKDENNNQTNSGGEEMNFNFNSLFTSNINPIDIENSDDEEDYKYKEISDKPFFENMKFDNFFTSSVSHSPKMMPVPYLKNGVPESLNARCSPIFFSLFSLIIF